MERELNELNYSVIAVTSTKETKEKHFKTYREALCYATNFREIQKSEIYKDEKMLIDFSY